MRRLRFTLAAAAFAALLLAWWATRPETPPGPAPASDTGTAVPRRSPFLSAAPAPTSGSGEDGAEESAAADAEPLRLWLDDHGNVRLDEEVVGREALKKRLVAYADGSRDEEYWLRTSHREVVLVVDPATPWWPVRQTLQLCADPDVRIWKIELRIGDSTHRLELNRIRMFPRGEHPGLCDGEVMEVATARPEDGGVVVGCLGRDLGRDEAGFRELEKLLGAALSDEWIRSQAGIDPDPRIEARFVSRLLLAMERAGCPRPSVEGAPPDYWPEEDLKQATVGLSGPRLVARLLELTRSTDEGLRGTAFYELLKYDDAWPSVLELIRNTADAKEREALARMAEDAAKRIGPEAEADLDAVRKGE